MTCSSTTQCTATSPTGSGTVDIRVTVGAQVSAVVAADQFSFDTLAPPDVARLDPENGPVSGGTAVTITGLNFGAVSGATTIAFGAAAATNATCSSTTQCTATSPAGGGMVDVRVTVGGQTSATSSSDQYTYLTAATTGSMSDSRTRAGIR